MTQKVPPDGVCTNTVDRRAQKLVDSWTTAVGKLRDLKPEIEWVQAEFKDRKGSETILGCRNFKTFCTTHLKRTEQAIYAMLGDYTAKAKAKKHPGAGSTARSTTMSTTLAQDSIERLKEAVDAAARHFELKQKGKEDEAKKMEETFHSIAKAEMLPGPMFSVSQRELMADFISANLDLYKQIENGLVNGISIKQLQTHVEALRKRFATVLGKSESQPKPAVADPVKVAKAEAKPEFVKSDNGFNIVRRKDGKCVVLDPAKEKNNTIAICDTLWEGQAKAEAKKETAPAGKADAATGKAS